MERFCLQAFTLTSLSFLTVFVNSLLSLYRSRHNPANTPGAVHHPQPLPAFPIPPVAHYPHLNAPPPPGWGTSWTGGGEVEETPPRRRKLENGESKEIK